MNKTFSLILIFSILLSNCNSTQNTESKCESLTADFRELIETEFNYCEVDKDCEIVQGICPLGCFFIIHRENKEAVLNIRAQIKEKCEHCVYKCPPEPKKLKCIQKVCYPEVEEEYVYFLFRQECDKIVELYSPDIVGKKLDEIDLHILNYEVIEKDSVLNYKKASNGRVDNLKLIVDKEGIIESISCFESKS